MDEIKTGQDTSSGKTTTPISTVVSSATLKTLPKPAKPSTKRRARRGSKIDKQVQMEIAQSALAKLGELGVEVLAREGECSTPDGKEKYPCVIITVMRCGITGKKFVLDV